MSNLHEENSADSEHSCPQPHPSPASASDEPRRDVAEREESEAVSLCTNNEYKKDCTSEMNKERVKLKQNDVYFKIWHKLDNKHKISSATTEQHSKGDELAKYVAEYADSTVTLRNHSKTSESTNLIQTTAAFPRKKIKTLSKVSRFDVDDKEPPDPKDELEQMAMNEILKEAKRGAERSDTMGPAGWLRPSSTRTNKRFLTNTLRSTLQKPFTISDKLLFKKLEDRSKYGKKGRYWSKPKVETHLPKDGEGTVKHDFYCYYLPESDIRKKLGKKRKGNHSNSGTEFSAGSSSNQHRKKESPTDQVTENYDINSSNKDLFQIQNGMFSVSKSLSVNDIYVADDALADKKRKKKHHKHKTKKRKKEKDKIGDSSSVTSSQTKDKTRDPSYKKRHKHKRSHVHKDNSKTQKEPHSSWDEWDASNYRDGIEIERKSARNGKSLSYDY